MNIMDLSPMAAIRKVDKAKAEKQARLDRELAMGVLYNIHETTPGGFYPSRAPLAGTIRAVMFCLGLVIGICVAFAVAVDAITPAVPL